MPSTLTWIDHDQTARERSEAILSLCQQEESRDELGLGSIRDSFADQLFPGTSTLQTRIRYMLIIPWMYRSLEQKTIPSGKFEQKADKFERDLIETLNNANPREERVIGGQAGREILRLPSTAYWSGLDAWKIRKINLTQGQYHNQIDEIYRKRKEFENRENERIQNNQDSEVLSIPLLETWHPNLPVMPKDFPEVATLRITRNEAEFLRERIQLSNPDSLFAHFVKKCDYSDVEFPWDHPDCNELQYDQWDLLGHARIFSNVMHGAALIYNLALSIKCGEEDWEIDYRRNLIDWYGDLDLEEIKNWPIQNLWKFTEGGRRIITVSTKRFVKNWTIELLSEEFSDGSFDSAISLIRKRETELKKTKSRFKNVKALEQWNGAAGLKQLSYRWEVAQYYINELHEGLQSDKG